MYNYYECTFLRPKHPIKVHVWAGISRKGRTGICVFEGKMNAELYVEILNNTLLPFIEKVLPDHRLFQDVSAPLIHPRTVVQDSLEGKESR